MACSAPCDQHGIHVVIVGGLEPGLDRAERVTDQHYAGEGVPAHRAGAQRRHRVVQGHGLRVQGDLGAGGVRTVALPDGVDVKCRVPGGRGGADVGIVAVPVREVPVQMVVGGARYEDLHGAWLVLPPVAQLPPHGLVGRPWIGDGHREGYGRAVQRGQAGSVRGDRRAQQRAEHGRRDGHRGSSENPVSRPAERRGCSGRHGGPSFRGNPAPSSPSGGPGPRNSCSGASRLKACGLCRSSAAGQREHVTVGTTVICRAGGTALPKAPVKPPNARVKAPEAPIKRLWYAP